MPLNLSKPTAGDVGWAAAINQNWTDIENQSNDQVTGPASATDNAVVRFDGATGKLVQTSAVTINDTLGQVSWPTGGGAGTRVLGPSDQDLAIAADSAGASSAGRALSLAGGPGGATSGAGGNASLVGGAPVDGNGGAVAITGAAGVGTNRNGGAVSITGGAATGSGTPGDVSFSARGGSATFNQSGQASLAAAYGSAGATSIIGALNAIAAGQVGGGTITGPGSSTDNAIARWDGTAGTVIQNSAMTISDTLGRISWPTGGGAGTRILGPTDQNLAIAAESAGASSAGRAVSITGGPGGATSGAGGAASLQGGAAAGGNNMGGAASVVGGAGIGTSAGGAASVTGGAGGATGAGGAVTITGGTGGSSSGTGGAVTIAGGAGGTTSGNGGNVTIQGGAPDGGDLGGVGGSVTIAGRNAAGAAASGGAVTLTAGNAVDSATGGGITATAGTGGGTGTGGAITFTTGAGGSTSGASGAITIGSGATSDGNTGAVTIQSAAAAGTNRSTGNLNLTCGAPTGTGTRGVISCTGNVIPAADNAYDLGSSSAGWKRLYMQVEINTTAGSSATINAPAGRIRTNNATFTLTNSLITANSIVLVTFASSPVTSAITKLWAVASAGSVQIKLDTGPSANLDVNFWVINND